MTPDFLLQPAVKAFIAAHENDDVAALALKKPPDPGWPYPLILDQIKARQKARGKIPEWLAYEDIVFPPAAVMEQASSAATARYKASLAEGRAFCDLTGGAGVDTWALARRFESVFCIEKDANAAALLAHNLKILGIAARVRNMEAEEFVPTMTPADLVMIDPQRRSGGRKGLFRLADCSPDITALLPSLRGKAGDVMLKTSPMLDIARAMEELGCVTAVHIVEWRGECREVIYLLRPGAETNADDVPVTAVRIDDSGCVLRALTCNRAQERAAPVEFSEPLAFLFEPGPAFQKSGAFGFMARHYDVRKLHPHTHLYTADKPRPDFPGRHFEVLGIYPADKKSLPVKQAGISVRNFPSTPDALRKKLGLKDGGPDTLFACTLMGERRVLIHARRTGINTG